MEDMEIILIEQDRIVMRDLLTGEVITLWSDPKVVDLMTESAERTK